MERDERPGQEKDKEGEEVASPDLPLEETPRESSPLLQSPSNTTSYPGSSEQIHQSLTQTSRMEHPPSYNPFNLMSSIGRNIFQSVHTEHPYYSQYLLQNSPPSHYAPLLMPFSPYLPFLMGNFPSFLPSGNRFILQDQPSARQRTGVNRFIVPTPLTICLRDRTIPSPVASGKVTASLGNRMITILTLVDKEGLELPPEKKDLLQCPDGSLSQPLSSSLTADFVFRLSGTSEGHSFRILFVVNYLLQDDLPCEERIVSRPFIVYSTRPSVSWEKPILLAINPQEGTANTEVWIKGSGFGQWNAQVTFNSRSASIVDCAENLITVVVPKFEVENDSVLVVEVSNKYLEDESDIFTAEKKLEFIYHPT